MPLCGLIALHARQDLQPVCMPLHGLTATMNATMWTYSLACPLGLTASLHATTWPYSHNAGIGTTRVTKTATQA